jgi:hypothetical protein
VLYCAYLLSGVASDWAIRLIGTKAYISIITLVLPPFAWLLSGIALRGQGRQYVAVELCPAELGEFLLHFCLRDVPCRSLIYLNITGAIVVLLSCMKHRI